MVLEELSVFRLQLAPLLFAGEPAPGYGSWQRKVRKSSRNGRSPIVLMGAAWSWVRSLRPRPRVCPTQSQLAAA